MIENDIVSCKRRKIGETYEIECQEKGKKPEKIICTFGTEEKSGGISAIGQYGEQNIVFGCVLEKEIDNTIAKKLGVKKSKIRWES
ncbi:MAG: hypothetical protein KAT28_00655 [Candidatus Aenigmarchaeota archaeon]|nr:hypothetical protein [Candidatus Aenigmarchaeota archaeon]